MNNDLVRHLIKLAIAGAAIGLFLFYRLYDRHRIQRGRGWLAGVLVVLAALSVCAYFDFGVYPKFGQFTNPHDFYHYYLGAKYSRELGYLNLYYCTVVADAEMNQGKPRQTSVRRMEDYRFVQANAVLAKRRQYRDLFSDARWEAFKQDLRYFESKLGAKRWPTVVRDKGYNATPVWNMVASTITNHVPAGGRLGLPVLVSLDLLLLTIMFALVGRAFGWRTMLFSVIFFGTMFMMAYTHIRGAFLRLDWITLLVMSTCLLKLNRYKTAGVLMAYAGLARMFPLVFAFGLGVKFLWDMVKTRTLSRRYLEFFGAFGVTLAALAALSVIVDGGIDHWRAFFTKIRLHDGDLSPIRVGFKYLFLMTYNNPFGSQWGPFEAEKLRLFEEYRLVWWAIQAVVLGISAYLVRHLEDYETIPYSYVLAFFLTAPTFYYQVMILTALFLFIPKSEDLVRTGGVVFLFGISMVMFVLDGFWPLHLQLSFSLSCLLLLLSLYLMAVAFLAPRLAVAGEPGRARADAPPKKHATKGKKRARK